MTGEMPNPLRNARIVASRVSYESYSKQEPGVERGDPRFVMSRGQLFDFARNPRTWKDGGKPERETDATAWGSLMDAKVCPCDGAMSDYVIAPKTVTATKTMGIVKRGEAAAGDQVPWNPQCKEAKDLKAAVEEDGKTLLSQEDLDAADAGYKRLMADERAAFIIRVSDYQVMVVWEYADRDTGLVIPGRSLIDLFPQQGLDLLGGLAEYLADYKTARNAEPHFFDGEIARHGYDWQAAIEVDAVAAIPENAGKTPRTFLHIIQENEPPYTVGRRFMPQNWMDIARGAYRAALRRYCQCLKTGVWPSWDDEELPGRMNLNGWSESLPAAWMIQ
jgi:hypothetical protein